MADFSKQEVLAVLRELYMDTDIVAQVRLKAAELCLGYFQKVEDKEDRKKDKDDTVADVSYAFEDLIQAMSGADTDPEPK